MIPTKHTVTATVRDAIREDKATRGEIRRLIRDDITTAMERENVGAVSGAINERIGDYLSSEYARRTILAMIRPAVKEIVRKEIEPHAAPSPKDADRETLLDLILNDKTVQVILRCLIQATVKQGAQVSIDRDQLQNIARKEIERQLAPRNTSGGFAEIAKSSTGAAKLMKNLKTTQILNRTHGGATADEGELTSSRTILGPERSDWDEVMAAASEALDSGAMVVLKQDENRKVKFSVFWDGLEEKP